MNHTGNWEPVQSSLWAGDRCVHRRVMTLGRMWSQKLDPASCGARQHYLGTGTLRSGAKTRCKTTKSDSSRNTNDASGRWSIRTGTVLFPSEDPQVGLESTGTFTRLINHLLKRDEGPYPSPCPVCVHTRGNAREGL